MTRYFHICTQSITFVVAMALGLLGFTGCVNIKATLPAQSYYTLSSQEPKEYECKSFSTIGLEVEVPTYLNSQQIIITQKHAQVETLASTRWLTLPSLLLQDTLESNARAHCVVLNTLGAYPLKLHIKVREIGIYQKKQARVVLEYTLLKGQASHKIRTFLSTKEIDSSDERAMLHALQDSLESALARVQTALCDDTKLCTKPR